MKRAGFDNIWLPVALLLPQLMIIAIFFYWPAGWALQSSFFLQDPFGNDLYAEFGTGLEAPIVGNFTNRTNYAPEFESLAVTEGIGKQLAPELDLMQETLPFFAKLQQQAKL